MTAMEANQELSHIILRVSTGGLEYDQAKAMAMPLLDIINNRGAEIAKKHKQHFKPLTWAYVLRLGI